MAACRCGGHPPFLRCISRCAPCATTLCHTTRAARHDVAPRDVVRTQVRFARSAHYALPATAAPEDSATLLLSDVPPAVSRDSIIAACSRYGSVLEVDAFRSMLRGGKVRWRLAAAAAVPTAAAAACRCCCRCGCRRLSL